MPRFIPAVILACALLFTGATTFSQEYQGRQLVDAKLVADTDAIVPGKPFTVGLLLKEVPGWHTSWQYPGDSGLATKIEWKLPPGFKASDIQWPLPQKESDEGDLVTYIYPDEVLLMVTITPPDKIDAKDVTLPAKASWLVCEKMCIPGNAEVSLKLPVAAQAKPANANLFEKYRKLLPLPGNSLHWEKESGNFSYIWHNSKDSAELDFSAGMPSHWSPAEAGGPKIDFYPLPAPGMMVEHPAITGKSRVSVKITSGLPDELSGVMVLQNGSQRIGWYVQPWKIPPPAANSSPGSADAPAQSLWNYLLLGFLGGMLLNVMPCVLPVITLKIYGFIGQAGQSRARILELGLAYCAGVFAWFLGLAALIVMFGLNWSFQFQNKGFIATMLVICLIFGLNLIGLFEVMIPGSLNSKLAKLTSKDGLGGSFVHGLFTTLMGSACTAPLLGPAIGFALAQPPPIIFSFFGTIAAGMALPYFLLTLNPGWMRFLPKPGIWMVRIKQIMGVLVIATAVWFGYVLYQQIAVKREAFAPMLQTALRSGRTVFVDFTADWCINCKVNERVVIKSSAVQEAFKKDDVLFVTADWTAGDQDITKLLKQFRRAGVPAYVIYPAGSDQPIVLSELLTPQIVLDGLKQAKDKSPGN